MEYFTSNTHQRSNCYKDNNQPGIGAGLRPEVAHLSEFRQRQRDREGMCPQLGSTDLARRDEEKKSERINKPNGTVSNRISDVT
jgi:hypothetical protein